MADSSVREVITLQFGHYSNFVGTHWWNIQESSFCYDPSAPKSEINHDCLFREGLTATGQETFTPRLLVYDLKGSLRNLPAEGLLYGKPSDREDVEWQGGVTVHQGNPDPKNAFQLDVEDAMCESSTSQEQESEMSEERSDSEDLENAGKVYELDKEVAVWSDYLGTQLHPRSIHILGEYLHDADTFPFDIFGYGQSLYRDGSLKDEFEDGLHFFVEECDHLQGFQVLTDIHNGFGGITSAVLEDLADEYGAKSIVTCGAIPSTLPCSDADRVVHNNAKRILNFALSFSLLSEHSSLFVPLSLNSQVWPKFGSYRSFPNLTYQGELSYHTSAILAQFLDTVTTPYRLDTSSCGMRDLIDTLAFGGRNIAQASVLFPLPVSNEKSLASLLTSSLNTQHHQLLQPVTPFIKNTRNFISQAAVMRGVDPNLLHNSTQVQMNKRTKTLIDSCQTGRDMLNSYFQSNNPSSVVRNWTAGMKCSTKQPFPNIFSPGINRDGVVMEGYSRPCSVGVDEACVMSALGISSSLGDMLESLISWAHKVDIRKHHEFLESGIEFESFKDILTQLSDQAQKYSTP